MKCLNHMNVEIAGSLETATQRFLNFWPHFFICQCVFRIVALIQRQANHLTLFVLLKLIVHFFSSILTDSSISLLERYLKLKFFIYIKIESLYTISYPELVQFLSDQSHFHLTVTPVSAGVQHTAVQHVFTGQSFKVVFKTESIHQDQRSAVNETLCVL